MASKAGHARLHRGLLLLHLTEQPPHENPGYAPGGAPFGPSSILPAKGGVQWNPWNYS